MEMWLRGRKEEIMKLMGGLEMKPKCICCGSEDCVGNCEVME